MVLIHLGGEEVVLMIIEVIGPSVIGHIVNGQYQGKEQHVSDELTQQEVHARQLQTLLLGL